MIGPFDNLERQGFIRIMALNWVCKINTGKDGKVKWSPFSTADPFGMLDINQKFGAIKEVLAYAKEISFQKMNRIFKYDLDRKTEDLVESKVNFRSR